MTSVVIAATRILAMLGEVVVGGGVPLSWVVLLGLLSAATTVAIVALARVVLALVGTRSPERPLAAERPDLATIVAQSDPDADGHVRARAPGQGGRVPFPALAAAVPPLS